MDNLYQKFKEISLIIAGALLGIVFIPFENTISNYFILIVTLIIILILFGIGLFEWFNYIWVSFNRIINKLTKKMCLYAPYEIDNDTSSWIYVSLRQLSDYLKLHKLNISIKNYEPDILKYPIVINPYGGVYPEKNTSTLESLEYIFDYVRNGGIYLNIADIPFYYAYDSSLNRRIDTTPLAGNFLNVRSFLQTILTKKLHCYVFALTNGKDFDEGITRVISLSNNSQNLFGRPIIIDKTEELFSPILTIPYGKGYFIFSTLELEKKNLNLIYKIIQNAFDLI